MLTPSDISDLYHRYSDRLLRYLTAGTGDPSTAEDLLHDTFLELCRGSGTLNITDDILHLLYTIAGRNLIDHYRRCDENPSRHDIYNDESPHGCIEQINYESRMEIVRACDNILQLPDLLRRTMYEFIGGRAPKIQAEMDGVTEGAVRTRIYRARRMMVNVTASKGPKGKI